jgi:hypothetical protein
MGSWLRRLFFGLGVALGVVAPQLAPELTARPYRAGAELLVNVEVDRAFGETAVELAAAGNRVALEVEASVSGSPPVAAVGNIRFDAAAGAWTAAAPGAAEKRVATPEAAAILASRAWGIRAGPLSALEGGGSVIVRARLGILDEEGAWHPAMMLWGYAEPALRFDYAGAGEVPY